MAQDRPAQRTSPTPARVAKRWATGAELVFFVQLLVAGIMFYDFPAQDEDYQPSARVAYSQAGLEIALLPGVALWLALGKPDSGAHAFWIAVVGSVLAWAAAGAGVGLLLRPVGLYMHAKKR